MQIEQDITTHLLEWFQSRTLTTYAHEDMEQQVLLFIANENAKWYNHFGKLVVSYKIGHAFII